jgi:PPOX class probable F420-dependent enzyme
VTGSAEIEAHVRRFIEIHRIAHLATADAQGRPWVIPVCYVFQNGTFYSVIDEKPKRLQPGRLRRVINIRENPNAALVIDDYSEDWQTLAYVHVRGRAAILESGAEHAAAISALRAKYPQYRSMEIDSKPVITLAPQTIRYWSAG